jgi:glutathione-regulated potassium-efflux system protein KefB
VIANPLFVIGMAAALVVIKTGVIFGLARLFGMATRPAFGLGLLLSQGGEFGFVLFAQAQSALLIEPEAASLFGAILTLSMATTPFLLMIARRFEYAKDQDGDTPDGPEHADQSKAIVVGFGRFGQTVGQMLSAHGVSVTLIDVKPEQIEVSSSFGAKVYYGDGRRIDLLRRAGGDEAQIIAFCLDDRLLGPKELEPILEAFPQASVFMRAFDRRQMIAVRNLDLAGTTRELFESAIKMGIDALQALGVGDEEIMVIERRYREHDLARLEAQGATGDMHAGPAPLYVPAQKQAGA